MDEGGDKHVICLGREKSCVSTAFAKREEHAAYWRKSLFFICIFSHWYMYSGTLRTRRRVQRESCENGEHWEREDWEKVDNQRTLSFFGIVRAIAQEFREPNFSILLFGWYPHCRHTLSFSVLYEEISVFPPRVLFWATLRNQRFFRW